jgi:hypothetical protein
MTPDELPADMEARTPAPEGEACPHDAYETDAAGQPVRCVDCGMAIASAASPVVPVGVSDQQRAKIELVLVGYRNRITTLDAATDAILAALRPTDTGANHE